MRILMVSDVYFPRVNGVSTSIQTFRNEFRAKGHDVTLIAPDYGEAKDDEDDIIRIPSRRLVLDPEDRMMRRKELAAITEDLRRQDFDIVHIQTPFVAHYAGVAISKQLNLPRIESYHTFFEEYLYHYVPFLPKSWLRFVARRFTKSQCNDVHGVIVPSTAMLEVLRNYGVQTQMKIAPTGIEIERFSVGNGDGFRSRFGIPADRPTLVHVGRVAHEKNMDFLLHVLQVVVRSIPDVLLVIAGEGPALNHLKTLTAQLGLMQNVLYIGYLDRNKDLLDCYCAGDAFIFASRTETQGLVLLEAMALGLPVVSTSVMGTKDILDPQRGALVALENVDDFAAKVIRILTEPKLRANLSADAKEYVKSWSAAEMADKTLAFYQTVINSYNAGIGDRERTQATTLTDGESNSDCA